ncbi:hydroxypyruvate isomerase family protein [Membranihabitans maritimus]|uniref:hydroxypyruvate isomerase family protein n=1 Tax=Membranihabitans maritimus TaxID=2904244 RepID=UPI001F17E1ED|nr:TIM barrel protein [Membranihabitans maritimus]
MDRKEALKTLGASAMGLAIPADLTIRENAFTKLKGNIHHSACYWCYNSMKLDDFCREARKVGLVGVDLLRPEQWETAFNHGLTCTMATIEEANIESGFNRIDNHDHLVNAYSEVIPKLADAGLKNVIVFSGNRKGMDDEMGSDNCARGLEPLVKVAERYNIVIQMELLNSKVNHPDYQCDHTLWGVELCKKVNSPNFKLLYDIYHMQIMEGDIIATIREYHPYIGHYHTGGVPGRHEIDDTQELYYPAIMKAILETGYDGYVAQEFIPARENVIGSLKQGVGICDV